MNTNGSGPIRKDSKKQALLHCCSGFDPGATNVFTAYLAKHYFDEIHELDIIDVNGGDHGYPFATNFNPEINIREVTAECRHWENGEFITTGAMSKKASFTCPEDVGTYNIYRMYHEELESLTKNSEKFIQKLNDAGIIVSIGHSLATYEETMNSFKSGVSFATHLFNAMTPLNSREPGIVGAVFSSKKIFAGIIADGFHVAYPNIELAHNILSDKLVLVTDATAAASSDIPSFDFVGTKIYIKNGQCVDSNNTLGGSSLTMIEAIKNCVLNTRITLSEAIKMATINPAKAIKCEQNFGRIKENRIANLAIFDHSLKMVSTVFEGNIIS